MIRGYVQVSKASEYNGIPSNLIGIRSVSENSQEKLWKMVVEILSLFSQNRRL